MPRITTLSVAAKPLLWSAATKAAPGFARRGLVGNCLECLRRSALGDRGKRLRVGDGDVRQNLAVQDDVRLLQAGDEARVRDAVQPARRGRWSVRRVWASLTYFGSP